MKPKRHRQNPPAIVSVHDVMPETLPQAMEIIGFLEKIKVFPASLLVVPGRAWPANGISALKSLQDSGYELAGHGWQHRAGNLSSTWHRLHGLLMSRNEAEHLSLSTGAVVKIISSCFHWFEAVGLAPPILYVPPAWAMGRIRKKTLKAMPFRLFETQTGVYDADTGIFHRMPVAGYMADTALRAKALKINNFINRRRVFAPLRIAVHPDDLNLPLAEDLKAHLKSCSRFIPYNHLKSL